MKIERVTGLLLMNGDGVLGAHFHQRVMIGEARGHGRRSILFVDGRQG